MKTLTTLVLLFITALLLAQDWALFPANQGIYHSVNYPQNHSLKDFKNIHYTSADSFRTELQAEIWYLNSKYLPDSLLKCIKPKPMDSLLLRNDTLFYHNFYFLPNAKPGDSWYLPYNHTAWFDSIKITYNNIDQIEFLGITDSVKTYSFEGIGKEAGLTNLNERVMRLSKHFGLIEYVPLRSLTSQVSYSPYFVQHTIFGIENDTMQIGYQPKKLEDFLPQYNAGDILFWRKYIDPHHLPVVFFYRDSIVQITENRDSIYYVYNRTTFNEENEIIDSQYSLSETFTPKNYINIVNAKPGLAAYGWVDNSATLDFSELENINDPPILENEHTHLIWHNIIHRYNFVDEYMQISIWPYPVHDNFVHLDNCSSQKLNYQNSFVLETGKGRVVAFVSNGQSTISEELIGTKINDIKEGVLSVQEYFEMPEDTTSTDPVAVENFVSTSTLNLYPNPANQFIYLDFKEGKIQNSSYQIVDMKGRIVHENKLQTKVINVGDLKSGIYFFRLKKDKNFLTLKFIKA